MTIEDRIQDEMKSAMKAKNEVRLRTLRYLKAELQKESIAKGEDRGALSDAMAIAVLTREAKRRKESAEQFRQGDRDDLAVKEEAELVIIEEYLPEQLSEDAVREAVKEVISAAEEPEFGAVMKDVMVKLRGQADGSVVSKIVKEELVTK